MSALLRWRARQVRYENTSDMLDDSSAARPRMDAVKAALHRSLAAPRTCVLPNSCFIVSTHA